MDYIGAITAAAEPAKKLIEAVTGAIGKVYEPRYIRRISEARAFQINTIGDAIRNNVDIPIAYNSTGECSIDTSDYEELVKRVSTRMAYQEITKQENIEEIVNSAYESLQDVHEVVDGEVSREWMCRFIDAAGDISTEELRKIWSKVLAGEVLQPSSFSLRTLECLRNLDVLDAKIFERLCNFVVSNRFVVNDIDFLRSHGMSYDDILHLDESGLLNSSGMISFKKEIDTEPKILIDFGDYILMAKSNERSTVSLQIFPLTEAGRELSSIVNCQMDLNLIKEICRIIEKKNSMIILSLHHVTSKENDGINVEDKPIAFAEDDKTASEIS